MMTKTFDGQTARFLTAVATCMPVLSGDIMQGWIDNPKSLKKALETTLMPVGIADSKTHLHYDTIIRVDRAIKPIYPDWMKEVMHPKLEATGPAEYDLAHVKPWLHESQKDGRTIEGHKLYEHLKQNSMLESCLSLRDGEEIQKRGVEAFRKYFGGKAVFLWKSVVRDRDGNLTIPYLVEGGGRVVLGWRWLGGAWYDHNPAARLASWYLVLGNLL